MPLLNDSIRTIWLLDREAPPAGPIRDGAWPHKQADIDCLYIDPTSLQMHPQRTIAARVILKRMFVIMAQAEGEAAMSEVRIGDIVLYHDPNVGEQIPAMIVKLESQERAWLNVFTIHGSMALDMPKPRGDQPGQWEPRPRG